MHGLINAVTLSGWKRISNQLVQKAREILKAPSKMAIRLFERRGTVQIVVRIGQYQKVAK
jgi:hypothetical protein